MPATLLSRDRARDDAAPGDLGAEHEHPERGEASATEQTRLHSLRSYCAPPARRIGAAGRLLLEDGSALEVDDELPGDLPLGWHRLVTDAQEVTLVVAPARMPEVPRTWGWMLLL